MEKSNKPVNTSWFGLNDQEGETVDADLLFDLLDTFKKDNVLTGKLRLTASESVNTTETDNDESQENKSVRESTESLFSNSDPVRLDNIMSETGSSEESGSIEEFGLNLLESSSTDLPNVENEKEQNVANSEIEEEEEEKSERSEEEEKSERSEEEEKSERSLSESEEKSNLEKLLATQEKYELYCPNCSSCITRKVILIRRKSEEHVDLSTDLKSDETVDEPDKPSEIEEMDPPVKVPNIEDDVQDGKEEGIILACLTCLKSFIQLGTRFLQLDFIRGKPVEEPGVTISTNTAQSLPQIQQNRERFIIELLKSIIYGGLTETITSLGVVSSASASGSSTDNILALAVANLAGGLIVLAQNLQDLINSPVQDKDRYEELLGRRANFKIHIIVAIMSYIFFGLIPPMVYAFSFYKTGIKNHKLISVFLVSLICVVFLGMIKVYVRKPRNSCESRKPYLKSAAFYTSLVVASSGISYVVGDFMGESIRKLNWVSLDQIEGIKSEQYRFSSF